MKKIIVIIFLFLGFSVRSQDILFKKSNFKEDKAGLKLAIQSIKNGDVLMESGIPQVLKMNSPVSEFEEALALYLIAQKFNSENSDLNRKIGYAYLYTNQPYLAKDFLLKSFNLNNPVDPLLYFLLGRVYQLEENFEQAREYYLEFSNKSDDKTKALYNNLNKKYLGECASGIQQLEIQQRIWVDNVKELNSAFDDLAPCITADQSQIIFSSNRIGNSDIYQAERVKRKWKNISPIEVLNTENDDIASSLAYDGQRILLFKYKDDNADIYQSSLLGDSWSIPSLKMSKVVNTIDNETFASYDPQDIKVYYISDGGHSGDKDIVFSGKKDQEERYWGRGQSPGHEINSSFHEGSVYLSPDGETMYFCSQGHSSIGGYDAFVSYRDESGEWGEPINLGHPINSPYDELYFTISANAKYAYFSSNRLGGEGGMDIYRATFLGDKKKPVIITEDNLIAKITDPIVNTYIPKTVKISDRSSLTVFKGKVLDGILETPIESEIKIFNNSNGQLYTVAYSNSATGKFLLSLPSGLNYGISVEAEGYLFHSENFNIPKGSEYNMVNKDIFLKNIDIGSKIALKNVFFEVGKSQVQIDSYPELDRLIQLMEDVPSLKIELSGHTDNVGNDEYNLDLSQKRADEVRNYLLSRGVDQKRVVSIGYGETRPVDNNETIDGRANNRRTEFEITDN